MGFYNIPVQNGGLPKLTSWLNLTGCHFGQGWWWRTLYTPVNCTMVFLSPSRLVQGIPQNGLTINTFLAIPKIGS